MECEPPLRAVADVVKVAIPLERTAEPICTVPSKNLTEPLGEPPDEGNTDAVKVTAWPYEDGLTLEVIDVVVAA
jgi:hypothetical protein